MVDMVDYAWELGNLWWIYGRNLKAYAWQPGAGQAILAPCWPYVGLCWAYAGPCWAILGAMLRPCLGNLCWNNLKMPICPPRAPSWSPKPRKNRSFVPSPRWNPLPPKGPKHRLKKRCFFNTARKIHCKLQVLQSTRSGMGVNRRWVGRGGSAYNLRLPLKACGKDHN